ncbi:hypothetical protein PQR46_41775 [Paraburkholderia sediminicola]|uniref:hypothetical protein n=1 Tax=Paraburkholderia sediminicola TaxID=458836 RepID=UPI0038B9E517
MTFSKYRRLFLVLVVPLLIAGYICGRVAWPFDRYVNILCAPFLNSENCRPVGPTEGAFYKYVKKDARAWFSINPSSRDFKSYVYPFAEASARMEFGKVVAAVPYAGNGPEVAAFMHRFVGKDAVFQLGVEDKKRQSIVDIDPPLFYCHTLSFGSEPGAYTADCYGEGWGAHYLPGGRPEQNHARQPERVHREKNRRYKVGVQVVSNCHVPDFYLRIPHPFAVLVVNGEGNSLRQSAAEPESGRPLAQPQGNSPSTSTKKNE